MSLRHASIMVLLPWAILVSACGDNGAAPPPPVSFIDVAPADTVLTPGDSALIRGQPVGVDGRLLDLALTFEVEDPTVGSVEVRDSMVSRTAVFKALQEGDTRIVVREEGGVVAFVPVRVRNVTGFSPEFAAFGATVTMNGVGFGPDSRIFFGSVPGVTESVGEDGRELRSWVPWDAENGPLRVVLGDGSETLTEEPFVLTGDGDDALEPNSITVSTSVELPFRNPFLRTRLVSMDNFSFVLTQPTPITVRVSDGEELNTWDYRSVVQLNREDEVGEFYGVAPVYSFGRDEPQDGVVTHPALPAGHYAVRVFVAPGYYVVDRKYSIEISKDVTYAAEHDRYEPNQVPAEAPFLELPSSDTLTLENPWAQDYFRIRLDQRSDVRVSVGTFGRSKGVFFYQDPESRSVHWHLADPGPYPTTWAGNITILSPIELRCTVNAGEYIIGVLDNEGVEGPYTLRVEAEPDPSGFLTCQQSSLRAGKGSERDELRARGSVVPR